MKKASFEEGKWILDRTIEFTRNVEQKASILFAVAGLFLSILLSSDIFWSYVKAAKAAPNSKIISIILLFLFGLMLCVALGFFVAVMIARLKCQEQSIIYFGGIVSKTSKQLIKDLNDGIPDNDLSYQIIRSSQICQMKFKNYNRCVFSMAIMTLFAIGFVLTAVLGI